MLGTAKKHEAIEYCERCSKVCDQSCRTDGARERAFDTMARFGPRI